METMEKRPSINFLFDEIITCGAVLSAFELCEAVRKLGRECNIIAKFKNKELEEYFNIEKIGHHGRPEGIDITFTPKMHGDYAYVRTNDKRWLTHDEPIIAVSKYIQDTIGGSVVIGNGTHKRFYNMHLGENLEDWEHVQPNLVYKRDIDVLIEGNYEPNKNIVETIKEARKHGRRIVWFGRTTKNLGVEHCSGLSLDEIVSLYNRSKKFLKMSKDEGWGRPIAEAKACGCEIINKSGGNKDIEIVSWESIAKQLIKYLDDRQNEIPLRDTTNRKNPCR